jgi:glycerophosphoryl diester phosphodiesterase
LYGDPTRIEDCTLAELQQSHPQIPSLAQLIERYGKKLHLMIELKFLVYKDIALQMQKLKEVLSDLEPMKDFHLLSLYPEEMFGPITFLPSKTLLPVAIFNAKTLDDMVIKKNYGGLLGQYVFMMQSVIDRQLANDKKIGLGFVDSKNNLYRQLNRGSEWLFSNNALQLQSWINQYTHR